MVISENEGTLMTARTDCLIEKLVQYFQSRQISGLKVINTRFFPSSSSSALRGRSNSALCCLVLVLYSWTVFGEGYPTLKVCVSSVPRM